MNIKVVKENETMWKWIKVGGVATAASLGVGLFLFGGDLFSYINTSVGSVRSEVRENVPVEFELARSRDMLEDIIPELQSNVKLIAKEEVAIEKLEREIVASEQRIEEERVRISKLRGMLETQQTSYEIGRYEYSRDEVKLELERRFTHYKEAEKMLETKRDLMASREQSLKAAVQMLANAKQRKAELEIRIESLEAQYRLIKANEGAGSLELNNSKLAQTEKLLDDIQTRLEVAERVSVRESHFIDRMEIDLDTPDETDLLSEVDAYFDRNPEASTREASITEQLDRESGHAEESTTKTSNERLELGFLSNN